MLRCMESAYKTASESDGRTAYLSSSDLRRLGRVFEDLSRKELLANVQIDALSELLKYLDTSMGNFLDTDHLSLDGTVAQDEQAIREKASMSLDYIVQGLNHVKLSITLFNGNGLEQHLFPEELLVASLTVLKSQLEETFLAPALEANSGIKSSRMLSVIVSDEALKAKLLSLVRITGEICEKLCRSDRADLSDDAIVKLVYTALSLFFIDTSDMALGPTEAESLRRAGSSLLRMVC